MRLALCLLLCACGRIGFEDPREVDRLGCEQGRAETCNGVDDDCNGLVDETCTCTPFDVTLAGAPGHDYPGFAWTGGGYLLAVDDGTQLLVQPIAEDGTPGTTTQLGAKATTAMSPARDVFAWTGAELAVAYTAGGTVSLARFDAKATPLGDPIALATNAVDAHVAWTGSGFGVAWHDTAVPPHLHLVELSPTGTAIGAEQDLAVGDLQTIQWLMPTPAGYLIAVTDTASTSHLLAWTRTDGQLVDRPLDLPTSSYYLQLAALGEGFLISARGTNVANLMLLAGDGAPLGAPMLLPLYMNKAPSYLSAVTVSPDRVRVIAETGLAMAKDVYFIDVDATGAVVASPTAFASFTSYEWSGNSAVGAAGRAATVLPFEVSQGSGGKLRVIQQCL